MIEKIEIRTVYGTKLTLTMYQPTNGLLIKKVTGLDPTKSNIVTTSFPRLAGTKRQSSRRESRDLGIKLGFAPNYSSRTVDSLRNQLYGFFMTGMQVEVRFYMRNGLVVNVDGEVETFDSPRDVQEPEATIGIYCFDPDFRYIESQYLIGTTTVDTTTTNFIEPLYSGTVDTGFKFLMSLTRDHNSGLQLRVRGNDGIVQTMDFDAPLLNGDVLEISTISGAKGAWVNRGSSRFSVLYGISPYAYYPVLLPGLNRIRVVAAGSAQSYIIEYASKYGGI
jgi:hypothetical protein